MEIRQLKTFQTVAQLLSFNRAAQVLNYAVARSGVTINDLAGEFILLPKHDCGYKMQFENMLSEGQVKDTTITELNSIETVKQCVIRGIGITIIPRIAVAAEIAHKQLTPLAWTDDTVESAVLMIRHKDKWISPVLKTFMDISREVCK